MYLLQSESDATQGYIGCAVDLDKRLKQHNGEPGSGDVAPTQFRPWKRVAHIPFSSRNEALAYEKSANDCSLILGGCTEFANYNELQRKAVKFKWFSSTHTVIIDNEFVKDFERK